MEKERLLWENIANYRKDINEAKLQKSLLQKDLVFKTVNLFNDIIPYLGIYKEIIKEIKSYLLISIFSCQLSADEVNFESFVDKMAYFELFEKSKLKLTDTVEEMELKLDLVNKSLSDQTCQNDKLTKLCDDKDVEIDQLKECATRDNIRICQLEDEIDRMNQETKEFEMEKDQIIDELNVNQNKLKRQCDKDCSRINHLNEYENGYMNLDKKFSQLTKNEDYFDSENNEKAVLENDNKENIKTLAMLSNDMLVLENVLLNDFQKQHEELKEAIIEQWRLSTNRIDNILDTEEAEISLKVANLTTKYNKTRTFFNKNFQKILTERNEYESRREQIQVLNSKPSSEKRARFIPELEEIEQMYTVDERSLNIYSAKLYYSTNEGKTFYESPDTKYCSNCGIKSVICQHNINQRQCILALPPLCSHLMIERPDLMVQKINNYGDTIDKDEFLKKINFHFRRSIFSKGFEEFLGFDELTKHFPVRKHPRTLSEEDVLSIFEDFWGEILLEDDTEVDIDNPIPIREKLRVFFVKRMKTKRPSDLAVHDFLCSLLDQVANNSILLLFCHILLGNINDSMMRYVFLLTNCIEIANVSNEEAFRYFIETLYPFLEDDEIDNLVLSFISYSENRFEKTIVYEFMLMTVLRAKDPLIIKTENEAGELPTNIERAFSMKEYSVFLETVCYIPNKKVAERLFRELLMVYDDPDHFHVAPLKITCQMVAYIIHLEKYDTIKTKLTKYNIENSKEGNIDSDNSELRWSYERLKHIATLMKSI